MTPFAAVESTSLGSAEHMKRLYLELHRVREPERMNTIQRVLDFPQLSRTGHALSP